MRCAPVTVLTEACREVNFRLHCLRIQDMGRIPPFRLPVADLAGRRFDINICVLSVPLPLKPGRTVAVLAGLDVRHLFSQLIYQIGMVRFFPHPVFGRMAVPAVFRAPCSTGCRKKNCKQSCNYHLFLHPDHSPVFFVYLPYYLDAPGFKA